MPSLVVSFVRTTKKEDHPGIKEELRKELSKLEEVPILLAFTIINDNLYLHSFLPLLLQMLTSQWLSDN